MKNNVECYTIYNIKRKVDEQGSSQRKSDGNVYNLRGFRASRNPRLYCAEFCPRCTKSSLDFSLKILGI